MNEKEKMLRGALYNASDATLSRERRLARTLLHRLNVTDYGDIEAYKEVVAQLLPHCASDIWIEPPFYCDYGYNIGSGANVFLNFNCVFLDVMPITIGSNVLFGPAVQLYTATHPLDPVERARGLEFARPITIGDDCWIGGAAVINPGVNIGDGVVIGAGSVVTKDVPDRVFAAGNPARVIKHL